MSNKYPGGIITSGANAGYSVAFDGTGDYLTWSGSTVGAGVFTFECWFNANNFSASQTLFGPNGTTTGGFGLNVASSTSISIDRYGVSADSFTVPTMSTNTWYHIAVVRNASNLTTVFLNGVRSSTGTITIAYTFGNVGAIGYTSSAVNRYFNGYISNARYTNTAVYDPTATTINVPTQLFAISGTQLLACNSPAIVDQSSNAFTITANGDAKVSTFTPFTGYTAYNPALGAATPGVWTITDALQAAQTRRWNMYDPYFNYTTLLLHGNGTNGAQNNTFLDSSSNNFTITRNGNTTQGTFSPFSQTGWSAYFDGAADYVDAPSAASISGTGDFTVEAWIFPQQFNAGVAIVQANLASSGLTGILINSNGTIGMGRANVDVQASSTNTVTLNAWNHVAVTRQSGTVRIFINGVQGYSGTITTSYVSGTVRFGTEADGTSNPFKGYISNYRSVSGTAVYTANFTPPAAPLTAVAGTTLIAFQANRLADSSANNYTLTRSGDVSVQPFSPFLTNVAYTTTLQGGSGYFDGTGDYLTTTNAALIATGDFTVEAWVYTTQTGSFQGIIVSSDSADTAGFRIAVTNGNNAEFWLNGTSNATTALISNQWNHIAMARSGTGTNNVSCYLNGTRVAQFTNILTTTNSTVALGRYRYNADANYLKGYISGARYIVGSAIYSGTTITVPTAPPTAVTNTQLLLNYTNAGITDATSKNVLETVGNAQISTTQSKFGGSSMYFDGTGDWLVAPTSNLFDFGTGDFTVEMWIYATSVGSGTERFLFDTRTSGTDSGLAVYLSTTGVLSVTSSNAVRATAGTVTANTWVHVAVSRSSGTLRAFVDGISGAGASYSSAITAPGRLKVGVKTDDTTPYIGYIDDLRITKGYARYTANFTPQTSQWQDQ